MGAVRFQELEAYCVGAFRHMADGKDIGLAIEIDPQLTSEVLPHGRETLTTGIPKNLLSNALKFTEQGTVKLEMQRSGWRLERGAPGTDRAKVWLRSPLSTPASESRRKNNASFSRRSGRRDGTTSQKVRRHKGSACRSAASWPRVLSGKFGCRSLEQAVIYVSICQTYVSSAPKPEVSDIAPLKSSGRTVDRNVDLIPLAIRRSGAGGNWWKRWRWTTTTVS